MLVKDKKPQVGIFELVDNKLYYLTQDMQISDAIGGAVDGGNLFHRDLCKLILLEGNLSEESTKIMNSSGPFWMKFPRGRVWYSVPEKTYYISSCKEILTNLNLVDDIVSEFALTQNKIQLLLDSDYTFYT